MLELLKSLVMVVLLVPVVMVVILGLIWAFGTFFNVISKFGHPKQRRQDKSAEANRLN
ncbi:AcrZ family multidrug efflux pump-associated protein [Biostraticola tofi]|uniref:Multidrug efflux pump accessory protein AcrZ n=1 Tax=Biostraticola tofi TaxID=466109 RepID=A0A4R3YXU9_9GAMM|nr:AcrZ family multidrug efflux pump-associated protein [Biostraticola tofi]TCV98037.1 multidrug efflux pump-associated protein AcrZ [Biostraticola tofi]